MSLKLSRRINDMVDLHLSTVKMTINALVDQGYVSPAVMSEAIEAWVAGETDPLDDLIMEAAEDALDDEILQEDEEEEAVT